MLQALKIQKPSLGFYQQKKLEENGVIFLIHTLLLNEQKLNKSLRG